MTRQVVRDMKRAVVAGRRSGANPDAVVLARESALSLLARSIQFGYKQPRCHPAGHGGAGRGRRLRCALGLLPRRRGMQPGPGTAGYVPRGGVLPGQSPFNDIDAHRKRKRTGNVWGEADALGFSL